MFDIQTMKAEVIEHYCGKLYIRCLYVDEFIDLF
jgi:hypothetical protein